LLQGKIEANVDFRIEKSKIKAIAEDTDQPGIARPVLTTFIQLIVLLLLLIAMSVVPWVVVEYVLPNLIGLEWWQVKKIIV
jgi:hypothetical protein